MFIYVIVNSETLKIYVGQHKGESLTRYLQQKWWDAHYYSGKRSHLYAAMRKYPKEFWSIHPLVSGVETRAELDEIEKHYIKVLKTQHPDVGYNICDGGEGFSGPHSEEAKQKLGSIVREQWANLSPADRQQRNQKSSETRLGMFAESRIAKAAARAARPPRNLACLPEQRKKISESMKRGIAEGRIHIYKLTLEDREKARQAAIAALTGVPRPPEVMAILRTPEVQAKRLAALRAAKKGKPVSAETKARMSEGKRRWWAARKSQQLVLIQD
jgi:hypothetical protein